MDITCYLALTAAELSAISEPPPRTAYMACHFSGSSGGISNLPSRLPAGAMVILDDLIPPQDHDPELICNQLRQLVQTWGIACFLLDFQRPDIPRNRQIAEALVNSLPCPVGVSSLYADELNCPVFLPPPPVHLSLEKHLKDYKNREIWLELAIETAQINITSKGADYCPLPDQPLSSPCFTHKTVCSQYHLDLYENRACFTLRRGKEELLRLLEQAQKLGVKQAVGMYQQLNVFP